MDPVIKEGASVWNLMTKNVASLDPVTTNVDVASLDPVAKNRLVMAQHSKAKMMNETEKVVLLGARRIGLLARRPRADGNFQNLDTDMPSWSRATWKDKC